MKIYLSLFFFFIGLSFSGTAQITQRERPAEWDKLVFGGRFMDRFLPMPVMGELKSNVWGGKNVVPRYIDNGIEDSIYSYWGGNCIVDENGNYHLFVCGWPENAPKGHMDWPNSTVFHAVSENSFGPYQLTDTIGKGHNPETFQLKDGRYVIYVIGGYYISSNLNGPWERKQFNFDARDREIVDGLSNVTFAKRDDGSFLAICRGGGVWFSKDGLSSYNQVTDKRVYPDVEGRFEDPVVWKTRVQYHMIVNDWFGRIAWYLRSKDGVNWKVDPGEAYMPGIAVYEDGTKEDWFKYERIKMLQDEYGRTTQAHFAVIDTIKWNDLQNDNHSSKHIIIPLTKERLIEVVNSEPLSQSTKTIDVLIKAENDFNPSSDIDFSSLRFGAPEVINYGGGCTLLETIKKDNDLMLRFDGSGNGFTQENFAGKLLGKTSKGQLLFGYSRLPGVHYNPPILSARKPVFVSDGKNSKVKIVVENFGQVQSETTPIRIVYFEHNEEKVLAEGNVKALLPFEATTLALQCLSIPETGKEYKMQVIISPKGQKQVTFDTQISMD